MQIVDLKVKLNKQMLKLYTELIFNHSSLVHVCVIGMELHINMLM